MGEGPRRVTVRLAFELAYGGHPCLRGPLPSYIDVLHSCDNPPCCEATHLFCGNARINGRDMVAKRRAGPDVHPEVFQRVAQQLIRRRAETPWWGEANGKARLTADQAREICRLRIVERLPLKQLAQQFAVAEGTISSIAKGKHWRRATEAYRVGLQEIAEVSKAD